jgi:hypothetical protein
MTVQKPAMASFPTPETRANTGQADDIILDLVVRLKSSIAAAYSTGSFT